MKKKLLLIAITLISVTLLFGCSKVSSDNPTSGDDKSTETGKDNESKENEPDTNSPTNEDNSDKEDNKKTIYRHMRVTESDMEYSAIAPGVDRLFANVNTVLFPMKCDEVIFDFDEKGHVTEARYITTSNLPMEMLREELSEAYGMLEDSAKEFVYKYDVMEKEYDSSTVVFYFDPSKASGGNTKIDPDFRYAIIDNVQDIEILKKYCYYDDANDSYPESEYVGDNFVRHIRLEYTVEWYN